MSTYQKYSIEKENSFPVKDYLMKKYYTVLILACLFYSNLIGQTINPITNNDAINCINDLFGQDVSANVSNANIVGGGTALNNASVGKFLGFGTQAGYGNNSSIEDAIVFSSGCLIDLNFTNTSPNTNGDELPCGSDVSDTDFVGTGGGIFGTNGAAFDAAYLEFTITVPEATTFTGDYVFSSDEYLEFINRGVNDAARIFVNGQNYALAPDGQEVSIDAINNNQNNAVFIDNTNGVRNIEADGLTQILSFSAPLQAGQNTIKIGVSDRGDRALDSWFFFATGSFSIPDLTNPNPPVVSNPCETQNVIDPPNIDGTVSAGVAPTGWDVQEPTPDIINGNGGHPASGTVSNVNGNSTSGGQMGIFLSQGATNEGWNTTLTGLTAGQEYIVAIEWQEASLIDAGFLGIGGFEYENGNLEMIIDGVSTVFTGGNNAANDTWETATVTFTAQATTANLVIQIQEGSGTGTTGGAIVIDSGNASSSVECPDENTCELCSNGLDDDGDGLTDFNDPDCQMLSADTDGDGIPNECDLDDDNDGILDTTESCMVDTDNDGIVNCLDTDSDGDGCPDAVEGGGTFTDSDTNNAGQLTGSVNANGIPAVAGTGQAINISQDALNIDQSCEECNIQERIGRIGIRRQ